ncbi:hypothetical protein N7517_004457 [Penicillium concentricum]|uniref:Uncharacterized protein n=1 Tax=Penicillium concentricum TaxID=293559 RepID=A0A9W9S5N1_9EURO|nr:uncharacterized protein N7517_004457 [Penicillium concentricum]KAJ5372451.1 hypothetical protein N7517_004457 [Penicillium concentricum]
MTIYKCHKSNNAMWQYLFSAFEVHAAETQHPAPEFEYPLSSDATHHAKNTSTLRTCISRLSVPWDKKAQELRFSG